jgi:hypothetical protein
MKESREPPWRGSLSFFLSSFLLLLSPCGGSIGDFEFSPQIRALDARNQLHELIS